MYCIKGTVLPDTTMIYLPEMIKLDVFYGPIDEAETMIDWSVVDQIEERLYKCNALMT